MATLSSLNIPILFTGKLDKLKQLQTGIKSATQNIAKYTAVATASAGAIGAMVSANLRGNQELINQAKAIGIATDELQKLQYAGEQFNVDKGDVTSSLENLTTKIGEASVKGSEDFARLGVSVRDSITGSVKSTEDVLDDLVTRFKSGDFSNAQIKSFSETLGLDDNFIRNVVSSEKTLSEFKKEAEDLFLINKDDEKKVLSFNRSLSKSLMAFEGLRTQISIALAPAMEGLSDKFLNLIKDNKDLINKGIKQSIDFITKMTKVAFNLGSNISSLITNTIGWKVALTALLAVFAPVKTIIAGVVLLVEDLYTAFKGGKSIIGGDAGILPQMTALSALLGGALFAGLKAIKVAMLAVNVVMRANPIGLVITAIGGLIAIGWTFKDEIISAFKTAFDWITDKFTKLVKWFTDKIETIKKGFNAVKSIFVDEDLSQGQGNADRGEIIKDKLIEAGAINSEFASNDEIENLKTFNKELEKLSKQDVLDLLATKDVDSQIQSKLMSRLQQQSITNQAFNNTSNNSTFNNNQNVNINVSGTNAKAIADNVIRGIPKVTSSQSQMKHVSYMNAGGGY
ncbi:hypothetical protein [Francisella marina]|uniref:Phage tail tape measure protein n=1 Tax=Francisella marina TaxID=2249302 RepID=A0ABX5ZJJ6_9GAMM|nr:hypothetical protein [Francisella marina]QEO57559.1 hypothetical protein F0R74_06725 [Francisella marina]